MTEFVASLIVIGIVLFAMSIGAIFGNRRIKGSCGGLNNLKKLLGLTPCAGCSDPAPDRTLRIIAEAKEKVDSEPKR